MLEQVKNINKNKLYVAESGHCFDIYEDLFKWLQLGNNVNPLTNTPFSREELYNIIHHKGLTDGQQHTLKSAYYGINSTGESKLYYIIRHYKDIFMSIYDTGYYIVSNKENIRDCGREFAELKRKIDILPQADKTIILSLRNKAHDLQYMFDVMAPMQLTGELLICLFINVYNKIDISYRPKLPVSLFLTNVNGYYLLVRESLNKYIFDAIKIEHPLDMSDVYTSIMYSITGKDLYNIFDLHPTIHMSENIKIKNFIGKNTYNIFEYFGSHLRMDAKRIIDFVIIKSPKRLIKKAFDL